MSIRLSRSLDRRERLPLLKFSENDMMLPLELIPIFDRLDEIERSDQLDAVLVAMLGQRPLDSAKGG